MRTKAVKLLGLGTMLILLVGTALAQPPAGTAPAKPEQADKKPSKLEEQIGEALKNNPDVRVAEAKVREAEADLNRVRLQVIQKIVAQQHTITTAQQGVAAAESHYKAAEANLALAKSEYQRLARLSDKKVVSQEQLSVAEVKLKQSEADLEVTKIELQTAKANLARAEAELPYLLGKGPRATDMVRVDLWYRTVAEMQLKEQPYDAYIKVLSGKLEGTMAEKIRKALDRPVKLQFRGDPLEDVLTQLSETSSIPLLNNVPEEVRRAGVKIHLSQEVPLGGAFQALEDTFPIRFGVREYGLLVAEKLPPDVIPVHVFWKDDAQKKPANETPKKQ